MSIFRVEKNRNYTVISKTAIHDKRLSWKAKGIIAYMLSLPDDWKFYIEELVTHSTDGEASFRSGLKELKDCGYVRRFPIREGSRIKSWETVIYEIPQDDNLHQEENQDVDSLDGDFQQVENQNVDSLDVENQRLLSIDYLLSTEKDITTTTVNTIELFEKTLCRLSTHQMERIYQWQDDFNGQAEIINEAIQIADDKNKRYFGFVEFLLKDWYNNKLSSLERIRAYEQEKFQKKKTLKRTRKPIQKEDFDLSE
jgi:DnaD/phage-associated family protein